MMPIPSLPTDNLYKFAAITGLFLFAVGLIAPVLLLSDYFEMACDRMDKIDARVFDGMVRIGQLAQQDELTKEERAAQVIRLHADFAARIEKEKESLANQLSQRKELVDFQTSLFHWIGAFGAGVSIVGFFCWYRYVQSIQDRLLALECDKLGKELSPRPSKRQS